MSLSKVLATAVGEVGNTELPAGSNRVKYWDIFPGYWQGQPWCVAFLAWVLRKAGEAAAFFGGALTASCGTLLKWYQAQGLTVPVAEVQPGDIVILNFSGTQDTQHCGLVIAVDGIYITTVEGNTCEAGSQSNGGMVCRKTRYPSQIVGVCRPTYKKEEIVKPDDLTDHWAEKPCRKAEVKAIMKGYPDGTFRPDKEVTRAELAVILDQLGLLD